MQKGKKVYYGDEVEDMLTEEFLLFGEETRFIINQFKLLLQNKRKPTDIVAFTDYFSFSATSLFFKHLQHYGGGITVGYFGNPNEDNLPFDSSLSPTGIATPEMLTGISQEYRDLDQKYGLKMQFAFYQTFFEESEPNTPLEFDILPVDERFEFYEAYTDSKYEYF